MFDLCIGVRGSSSGCDTSSLQYNGTMDEISIFKRALSDTEIQEIYDSQIKTIRAKFRTCDDAACSGESFSGFFNSSPIDLGGETNQFIQTQFFLETANNSLTPLIDSFTYDFESPGDTEDPKFTVIPANATLEYNVALGVSFTATDDVGIDIFFVNDSNFTINSTGFMINNSILALGQYELNVSVNDTSGRTNQTAYRVTVNQNTGACGVNFNETSPTDYLIPFLASTNCTSDFTLLLNGTSISNNSEQLLAAGLWNFTVQRTDNINYSIIQDVRLFTVDPINPDGTITGSTPIIYEAVAGVSFTETNTGDADVDYLLNRDGVVVSDTDNDVLAVGSYGYVLNTTGGQNYTANISIDTFTLVINQNTDSCFVNFNETSPLTYNAGFTVSTNCTSAFTLLLNGSSISNNSAHFLAAGLWNFTVQRTDNANYTIIQDTQLFTIDQATPALSITLAPSATEDYLVTTTATGVGCASQLTCVLHRDSVVVSNPDVFALPVAVYNYTFNTTGNENFTALQVSSILTVNAINPDATLGGTTPITYLTAGDVTITESNTGDGDVSYLLFRDSIQVSDPDTTVLAVGTFEYLANTTGGANYTANASLDTFTLVVNKNPGACGVNFNETSPIVYPAGLNVSTNCTSAFNLFVNGTTITNNSGQFLAAGLWNFTVQRIDNANFTIIQDVRLFTVSKNAGACDILFNETSPQVENTPFEAFSNCNSDFFIQRNGTTINNNSEQVLAEGVFNFTVFRNDTVNFTNILDEEEFVMTSGDVTGPNVTIISPTSITFTTTTILFNVSSVDIAGVSTCQYTLDGGINNISMSNPGGPFFNATNNSMPQGGHTARFYCNDTLGNLNDTETVTFIVDTIGPVFDNLRNLTHDINTSFSNSITATDASSSVANFSLNDTSTFTINTTTGLITNNTSVPLES